MRPYGSPMLGTIWGPIAAGGHIHMGTDNPSQGDSGQSSEFIGKSAHDARLAVDTTPASRVTVPETSSARRRGQRGGAGGQLAEGFPGSCGHGHARLNGQRGLRQGK